VAIVTVYFVFARSGSTDSDPIVPQPAPTESAATAASVADTRPVESTPIEAPPSVPDSLQNAPDSSKPIRNALPVPATKKTPDPLAKAASPVVARKGPVVPPAAVETAKSQAPKLDPKTEPKTEPSREAPHEATPPSGLDDNAAGVETVTEVAPAALTTTISPGTLIPIDEADVLPVSLSHRAPAFSLQARQMRLSGAVVMNVLVNERGTIDQVVLVTEIPNADVNDDAIRAAQSWTYRPATKNGVPVKVWKSEQIVFKF